LLSAFGWTLLCIEEIGALVYDRAPLLPDRLFMLTLAALLALNVWAAVRSVLVPVPVRSTASTPAERTDGASREPSTGDLAFGLGREFERNINGTNGSHLRAVSDRHN